MAPFVITMWLGSMSPERDFDVLAYHFEGPKEYFEAGRIAFLPHNVYTNFPFFAEMLVLLGMVLRGDWYWGAIVGKAVLFAFAPLTALTLYAAGRRYFSPQAGLMAALVFLSTPWIDRITIITYVEGPLTFFVAATLLAVLIALERFRGGMPALRDVFRGGAAGRQRHGLQIHGPATGCCADGVGGRCRCVVGAPWQSDCSVASVSKCAWLSRWAWPSRSGRGW